MTINAVNTFSNGSNFEAYNHSKGFSVEKNGFILAATPFRIKLGFVPGLIVYGDQHLSPEYSEHHFGGFGSDRIREFSELTPFIKIFPIVVPRLQFNAQIDMRKAFKAAAAAVEAEKGIKLIVIETDNTGEEDAGTSGIGASGTGNVARVVQFDVYQDSNQRKLNKKEIQKFLTDVRNRLRTDNFIKGLATLGIPFVMIGNFLNWLNQTNPVRNMMPSF